MTQAQPEKRPAQEQGENPAEFESFKPSPLPDERLTEIRAKSTERFDGYDSDTRWLLRYVDMLRKDNEQLRTRRTSFEHKMFSVRSEERRVGKGVDLGGRRIIKKKKIRATRAESLSTILS